MKIKYGLIFAAMLSTSVIAQNNTTPPPLSAPGAAPADATPPPPASVTPPEAATTSPSTTAPAKPKKVHKRARKKTAAPTAAMPAPAPLVTNAPAEVIVKNVNIRGQAHISSEVIGHLKKGDVVTVLELVTLKHPHTDEPANWARIAMPADIHAWINSSFIDSSNQTVTARKLNIRSGPGENYSVVGLLHKGDAVKTTETKGSWTAIEPPGNSFAFVAAHLLAPKPAEATPPPGPIAPPTTTSVVQNSTPIAPPTTEVPGTASAVPPAMPPIAPPVIPAPQPAAEEPLPKRVVEREGLVGGTVSIQAPSHYELHNLDDGHVMDYLYTTSTNLPLKRYKGLTVLVSGEEELDERWPNTPVITIQRIQVVK